MSLTLWAYITLPLFAAVGAFTSLKVRQGSSIWWIPVVGILPTISWIIICRYTGYSLAVAGSIYDALYDLGYFITLVALGEPAVWYQWIGMALVVIGIVLMGGFK